MKLFFPYIAAICQLFLFFLLLDIFFGDGDLYEHSTNIILIVGFTMVTFSLITAALLVEEQIRHLRK